LTKVFILLGSNIDKEKNIPQAIQALHSQPDLMVSAVSPFYQFAALNSAGEQDETLPAFHNAAVFVETTLAPLALRATLRQIEADLGRVRTVDKFAPRPIDLDIIYYGQSILTAEEAGSRIPDPDSLSHAHIAIPLADIAPDWQHPETGQPLREIAEQLV